MFIPTHNLPLSENTREIFEQYCGNVLILNVLNVYNIWQNQPEALYELVQTLLTPEGWLIFLQERQMIQAKFACKNEITHKAQGMEIARLIVEVLR